MLAVAVAVAVTCAQALTSSSFPRCLSQPQNLADASGITSFLQLPSPPSNEVLLGESFACYIRLINLADFALSNVNVKVRHAFVAKMIFCACV